MPRNVNVEEILRLRNIQTSIYAIWCGTITKIVKNLNSYYKFTFSSDQPETSQESRVKYIQDLSVLFLEMTVCTSYKDQLDFFSIAILERWQMFSIVRLSFVCLSILPKIWKLKTANTINFFCYINNKLRSLS